jgi:uncharacterized membrane protein YdbT with pleckstrin-like domain
MVDQIKKRKNKSAIKKILIACMISISVLLLSFSFFIFVDSTNKSYLIIDILSLPAIVASMFRFGSGDIAFYFVVIIEFLFLSFISFLIIKLLLKNNS